MRHSRSRSLSLIAESLFAALLWVASPAFAEWSTEFGGPGQLTGSVRAVAWYGGQLVAGGESVVSEDGTILHRIGAWDGIRWNPLGDGVRHSGCPGPPCWALVKALATYGDLLVAGGNFIRAGGQPANFIAAWDGTRWRPLGLGMDDWVHSLLVDGSDLYAGGEFATAGGLPAAGVARWTGFEWQPLGTGLCCGFVTDLVMFEGKLFAAGRFEVDGEFSGVAVWDGVSWRSIHSIDSGSAVNAIEVFDGALVAGGDFELWEGPFLIPYGLARWDGSAWFPLGPREQPGGADLAVFRGKLLTVGGLGAVRVFEWDGNEWAPFKGSATNDAILCFLPMDSTLYIGGWFTEAGGVPSRYVARWNEPKTPVLLKDFHATWSADGGAVHLEWRLAQWDGLVRMEVERGDAALGPFRVVSPPLSPQVEMQFTDATDNEAADRWYRLVARTRDGAAETLGPFFVAALGPGRRTAIAPIFDRAPGPLSIRYALGDAAGTYRLAVYDVTGRLVRVLEAGRAQPGDHVVAWDRRSDRGHRVARSSYCIRLEHAGHAFSRKVALLHP